MNGRTDGQADLNMIIVHTYISCNIHKLQEICQNQKSWYKASILIPIYINPLLMEILKRTLWPLVKMHHNLEIPKCCHLTCIIDDHILIVFTCMGKYLIVFICMEKSTRIKWVSIMC